MPHGNGRRGPPFGGLQDFPRGPGKLGRSVRTLQEAYEIKGTGGVPGELRTDGGIYLHHEIGSVLGREQATQDVTTVAANPAPGVLSTLNIQFEESRRIQWLALASADATNTTFGFIRLLDEAGAWTLIHMWGTPDTVAPALGRDYLPNRLRDLPFPFLVRPEMTIQAQIQIDAGAPGNVAVSMDAAAVRTTQGLPIPQ